jgi:hypothetical protein
VPRLARSIDLAMLVHPPTTVAFMQFSREHESRIEPTSPVSWFLMPLGARTNTPTGVIKPQNGLHGNGGTQHGLSRTDFAQADQPLALQPQAHASR